MTDSSNGPTLNSASDFEFPYLSKTGVCVVNVVHVAGRLLRLIMFLSILPILFLSRRRCEVISTCSRSSLHPTLFSLLAVVAGSYVVSPCQTDYHV